MVWNFTLKALTDIKVSPSGTSGQGEGGPYGESLPKMECVCVYVISCGAMVWKLLVYLLGAKQ